jgi:hypothetical protein
MENKVISGSCQKINSPFPLKEIVHSSAPLRRELKTVYHRVPATRCLRQVRCCALLPEVTFLEALPVVRAMMSWPPRDRINVMRKIIHYFFCNAVEIGFCPFLQGKDCLIYPDRFFGCRAYGLWSREYYQKLAAITRQNKRFLQTQWENLGISLPEEVLTFEVPYCSRVETDPPVMISDEMLSAASDRIENLSGELNSRDREFREIYFSDLSFFLTGLQFGSQDAVRLKYFITRDMIQKGDSARLNLVLDRVMDPF